MYLPEGWSPRPEQLRIYKEALEILNEKKVVFIDAPTGIGKSIIARALMQEKGSGAVVTATKQLQEQYKRDFPELVSVVGKSNFNCSTFFGNCEQGYYSYSKEKKKMSYCKDCPYMCRVQEAVKEPFYVANYASYLHTMLGAHDTERIRGITIFDEGHRVEQEVLNSMSFTITDKFIEEVGYYYPDEEMDDDDNSLLEWVGGFLEGLEAYRPTHSRMEADKQHLMNAIAGMIESLEYITWIPQLGRDSRFNRFVSYKPLSLTRLAAMKFFDRSEKIVVLSATILNPRQLARSLRLSDDEWGYIQSNEAYDADTRPIIFFNDAVPVTRANMEDAQYYIAEMVQEILDRHPDEKGLIHTGSTKLAKFIKQHVDDPDDRLLQAYGVLRKGAYAKHLESDEPTVLVSPSMYEGVDLKGELARFLIVAKFPFMSLGDKQTKRRADMDWEWYNMSAVRMFMQATGRGTREEGDYCVTYVFDGKAKEILDKMERSIPVWYREAYREE